jgi:hypothetical protein
MLYHINIFLSDCSQLAAFTDFFFSPVLLPVNITRIYRQILELRLKASPVTSQ